MRRIGEHNELLKLNGNNISISFRSVANKKKRLPAGMSLSIQIDLYFQLQPIMFKKK